MTRGVTIELIADAVADVWGVSVAALRGPRRLMPYVDPRHVAFALARKHTSHSLPVIGQWFGDRDHTTVINGLRRYEVLLADRERDKIIQVEHLIEERRRATFVRANFVRNGVPIFRTVRKAA